MVVLEKEMRSSKQGFSRTLLYAAKDFLSIRESILSRKANMSF